MFIPNKTPKVVKLIRDVNILAGKFTVGHIFSNVERGERGYNLIDEDGNGLLEISRDSFFVMEYK